MSIEFLGHKHGLLGFLMGPIEAAAGARSKRVADIFCGTGAVSSALKSRGHTVFANDSLALCATLAGAILLNDTAPRFEGVLPLLPKGSADPYTRVLSFLMGLPGHEGFVTQNYSPRAGASSGHTRSYFTEANALRIDAVRHRIDAWTPLLAPGELALLLSDLVRASNAVSNIAGTYGCYMKYWKARALEPLQLRPFRFVAGGAGHSVTHGDAAAVAVGLDVDIVYADPPYTKRQYSAYYHVPETIVLHDAPELLGSTGLRPWRENSSAWCYRRHAPKALADLVAALTCKWFFLSYSEDGQIPHSSIMDILSEHGEVTVFEQDWRRYKSADRPHRGNAVTERLYQLRRTV